MEPSRWSPYDQQYSRRSSDSPHLAPSAPEDSVSFAATNSNPLLMSSCQGMPVSRTTESASAGLPNSNYESIIPPTIQSSKEAEFYDETLYNGVCKENQSGLHNFLQSQGSVSRTESFTTESPPGYTGQMPSQTFHSSNVELPVSGSFGVLPHESVKNHPGRFERNSNEKFISKQPPVSYNNGPYSDRDVSSIYSSAPLSAQSAFSGDTASLSPVVNSVTSPSLSNFSSPSEYYSSPKTNFGAYNSLQSPVPLSPSVAQSYPSSPYTNVDPVSHISTAPPCSPMSGGTYVNNMNVVPQRNGQKSQHSPNNNNTNNVMCYNAPQSQNVNYHGPPSVLQKTSDYHSDYAFAHDHNSPSSYSSVYPVMHTAQMSGGSNPRISPRTHTPHSNSIPHDGRMSYGHSNTIKPAPISSPTFLQNKVNHDSSYSTCPPNIPPGQSMHPPRYPPSVNSLRSNIHANPPLMPDHIGTDRQFNYSSDLVDDKNTLDIFNSHVDSGIHSHDAMNSITPFLENDLNMMEGDVLATGRNQRSSEPDDIHQNHISMEASSRTLASRPYVSRESQKEIRSQGALNYQYNSSHLDPVRPGNFSFNGPRRRGRRGRRRRVAIASNYGRFQSFKNDCNFTNGYPYQPPAVVEYNNADSYNNNSFEKRLCNEKEFSPLNYPFSRYRSELKMNETQKRNCSVILSKPTRKCISIEDELSFLGNLKFPDELESDSPQTFMLTRNKDTEGFLQCYKNFLASRKSCYDSNIESLKSIVKSKTITSVNKEHKNKSESKDSENKNERSHPRLVLQVDPCSNEWRLKYPILISDDEEKNDDKNHSDDIKSASDNSNDSSQYNLRENDAEEKSKRLKHTGKLNKLSEKYSKHSANRKRTHNDLVFEFSDTNSETLPAGDIRIKPEIESSPQYDMQSYSPKKRGRKTKNSSTKTESKKKARRSSLKAMEASTSEDFVPIKIKQEIIEDEEVAVEGARRSLRTRRSDTSSSQEITPGPSIKQEKMDVKEQIDISSDEIDVLDDSDSDPAWTPSVKTPKSAEVKAHMQMSPRKRGPKSRRRNSSGNSAAPRQKKEKSEKPRKRNSSSHNSGAKKQQTQQPDVVLDPNIKVKKEKEHFLVAKADIDKKTPFIWRVDKETNMLQRFEWYEQQGIILYRSTYTYAAWNENSFSNYVTANVRIVSHSRILYVVEYLGPELNEKPNNEATEESLPPDSEVPSANPLRENFEVFLQTLISQALDPNFLSEITNENDEYFLNNIKEIENVTENKKKNLVKEFWEADLLKCANMYPSFDTTPVTPEGEQCEVCKKTGATKVLKFNGEPYDSITLGSTEQASLSKTDYKACDACLIALSLYSHLHHQKYNFFIKCRSKMNDVKSTSDDKLESHVLLEECLQDHKWVDALFGELEQMWKECDEKS